MHVGFIGSGNVARALGGRLAAVGHSVSLGARITDAVANTVSFERATAGDVVILAVPFAATYALLPKLSHRLVGKIVVDATNPVNADWSPLLLGQESSGGEEVARMLPGAYVVKAFNTIFADVMRVAGEMPAAGRVTCFIASDHVAARRTVAELSRSAGFAPLEVGGLKVARHLEAVAHLNIQIAVSMNGGTHAGFVYQRC